jgi:hypothetical protein
MTVWGGDHLESFLPQSTFVASQHISQERYLPPNTKHVIEAAIYARSSLCAIMAQPLVDESPSHYVLSLIGLPTAPPGTAKGKKDRTDDKYKLLWQRDVSWDLFSSSETHPIVKFSSQGKYIIFGSTERFGVVGIEKGSSMFDPVKRSCSINAYYLHHEFLFILDNDGARMRVYDISSGEQKAEGAVPWSMILSKAHKQATGLVRLHHTQEQRRQQLRDEYQIAFCGGRLWISGFFNFDLICSAPRLLRRLRSQIVSTGKVKELLFTRVKNDLQLTSPKTLHVWNDTHLYVVDSTKLHCWKARQTDNGDGNSVDTLLSGNDYIESVSCDGTKLIVATNCTFRNTNTREWDGSGTITVIPIDSYEPSNTQSRPNYQSTPSPGDRRSNTPILNLMYPRSYSPVLQLYNKRFFRHHTFTGRINAPNGHGSSLQTLRHPVSSSTESNYRIVDMCSVDCRYVLVRCKKGNANKIVLFDLYIKSDMVPCLTV